MVCIIGDSLPAGEPICGSNQQPAAVWVGNLPVPITEPDTTVRELCRLFHSSGAPGISTADVKLGLQGGRYRGHAYVLASAVDCPVLCSLDGVHFQGRPLRIKLRVEVQKESKKAFKKGNKADKLQLEQQRRRVDPRPWGRSSLNCSSGKGGG